MAKDMVSSFITDTRGMTNKELRAEYRRLMKVANERIKTTTKENNIQHAQAYKNLVQPQKGAAFIGTSKSGYQQFKGMGTKATRLQLQEALVQVKRFLAAKTSTVAGIKEVIAQRREIIEQRTPGLTKEQQDALLRWLGSAEGQAAKEHFDSDQVIEFVGIIANAKNLNSESAISEAWRQSGADQSSLGALIREIKAEFGLNDD